LRLTPRSSTGLTRLVLPVRSRAAGPGRPETFQGAAGRENQDVPEKEKNFMYIGIGSVLAIILIVLLLVWVF
jgi:hypothetical protein